MPKPALGRGLGALLGGVPVAVKTPLAGLSNASPDSVMSTETRERVERILINRIHPSELQPRKDFPETSLRELADSIKEQGIIQPLIVRSRGQDFELIAGERRWRASQMLGLREVPAIIRESDDRTVLELMLIENLQRENLNPLEEALGYEELIGKFDLKQEEVALKVGKSRAAVANALRLLKLGQEIQHFLRDGRLSVGHAKVILGLTNEQEQLLVAHRILKNGMSVRETEEFVAHLQNRAGSAPRAKQPGRKPDFLRDAHVADLENRLQQRFGAKVALRYRAGKGSVQIHFFNDDDLERVLGIVGVKVD
jgi:ParB family chromosome partitioning protein